MQVKELIEALSRMDAEAEVHFSYNYGDHWRTQVAPSVSGVESGVVEYSEYHRMDKVADEPDEEDFQDETAPLPSQHRLVVILS